MHYYFSDKTELIVYRALLQARAYAATTASPTRPPPEELLDSFAAKLVETLQDEAPMHRLWYDLRTQSMFEETLREAVLMIDRTLEDMIWRVVSATPSSAERRSR